MKRSLKKSFAVNELNYFFQLSDIQEDVRSRLIPVLFENPRVENTYLLNEDIHTLEDLENRVCGIINQRDCIAALLKAFSVTDDLAISPELREILFSNIKLAFFVGAGVSKLLNIPLWNELADHAVDYMKDNSHINHTEASKLRNEKYTPKQILSIFHKIVRDKTDIKTFYSTHLARKENKAGNPYELLFQIEKALAKPIVKLSTNIDLEWETTLKDKGELQRDQSRDGQIVPIHPCYAQTQYSDFTNIQKTDGSILYQIHGSLHDLDRAIITTARYVDSYRDDNGLKGFLENVFREYVVLFVGSGIQEFEILEHCLKQSPFEHYALVGTQMGEENLFRIKKAYFKEIRIKAVPYYLDFQGYDRLLFVLQSWVDEISSSKKKQFYDNIRLIDEVL